MLEETDLDDEIIDRVCFLIGNHHSYQKIDGNDFQILVEADFLVNAFEDQLSVHSIESVRKKSLQNKNWHFTDRKHVSIILLLLLNI